MSTISNFNPLSATLKINTYLTKILLASAPLLLSLISVAAHGASNPVVQRATFQNQSATYHAVSTISRAEAANPDNFKFISVNGRMVSQAMQSCPIRTGLIACALKKLELINDRNEGIDDDYDMAQSFVYPSTIQPKTAVVVITRSGLMDDSVSAERYRISFILKQDQRTEPGWHWVQYGEQFQCARGSMAGQWTKNNCL